MEILNEIEKNVDLDEFEPRGKSDDKKVLRARLAQIHHEIKSGEDHVVKMIDKVNQLKQQQESLEAILKPEAESLLEKLKDD